MTQDFLRRMHRVTAAVFLAAVAWALLVPAAYAVPVATGAVIKVTRELGPFTALSLATASRVQVRQGDRQAVEVEAEASVLPLIDTRVVRGSLVVEDTQPFDAPRARVTVVVTQLSSVVARGATRVEADALRQPQLALTLAGSSRLVLRSVAVERLKVQAGGSSQLKASGRADDLALALGGSSSVEAAGLQAAAVSVSAGGSTSAVVWARDALSLGLGGASEVRYYGQPRVAVAQGGSASVQHLGSVPPQAK